MKTFIIILILLVLVAIMFYLLYIDYLNHNHRSFEIEFFDKSGTKLGVYLAEFTLGEIMEETRVTTAWNKTITWDFKAMTATWFFNNNPSETYSTPIKETYKV